MQASQNRMINQLNWLAEWPVKESLFLDSRAKNVHIGQLV